MGIENDVKHMSQTFAKDYFKALIYIGIVDGLSTLRYLLLGGRLTLRGERGVGKNVTEGVGGFALALRNAEGGCKQYSDIGREVSNFREFCVAQRLNSPLDVIS